MSDPYGMADSLTQVETERVQTMTFNGTDYPCIIGARTDANELGVGGYATSAGIEVVARRSLFSTLPTSKDDVTINGKVQKVTSVMFSPDESCIVLTCEDANKDA